VNGDTGSVKFNFPDREPWELEESCALDLAEDGASTFEEIGRCLNVTRERTRQLTSSALAKIVESLRAGGAIADDDVPRESRPQA
jgi:DNA-directed RNA polymerase sigma subunit (sigma70/sigma32)